MNGNPLRLAPGARIRGQNNMLAMSGSLVGQRLAVHYTLTAHGDSMPGTIKQKLDKFIADADVLITDAQYSTEEYQQHVGWGHGCVDDVVRFAIAGGVKRLYLFHHDPEHDDRTISSLLMHARAVAAAAGSSLRIEAAREGEQYTLTPRAVGAM